MLRHNQQSSIYLHCIWNKSWYFEVLAQNWNLLFYYSKWRAAFVFLGLNWTFKSPTYRRRSIEFQYFLCSYYKCVRMNNENCRIPKLGNRLLIFVGKHFYILSNNSIKNTKSTFPLFLHWMQLAYMLPQNENFAHMTTGGCTVCSFMCCICC